MTTCRQSPQGVLSRAVGRSLWFLSAPYSEVTPGNPVYCPLSSSQHAPAGPRPLVVQEASSALLSGNDSLSRPEWKLHSEKAPLPMGPLGQAKGLAVLFLKEPTPNTHVALIRKALFTNESFLSSQIEFFFRKRTDGAFRQDDSQVRCHSCSGGGRGGGRGP